jgi:hypothetical protein
MNRKKVIHFLLVLFFTFSILGLNSQNLLENGGFEEGQTGWSNWGDNLVISNENPQEGLNSARFTGANTLEQTGIAVEPGTEYKLSFWVRINSMAGSDWGGIRIAAIESNWSQTYASEFYTTANRPAGEWFNEVISFEPITSSVRVQVQFFAGEGWTSYDFQVDNMNLFEDVPVNEPPVIESLILNPTSGTVPFTVTGSVAATDPDGVIQNYVFDMGDGAVYTGASTVSHTYRIQGSYTLRVTVVDDEGATAFETENITASGSNNHTIQITSPPGGTYATDQNEVTLLGNRQNGMGDVFWINHRTGQSGFAAVSDNQFEIINLALDAGNNIIHVQSANGAGNFVVDQIAVQYTPAGYNGPVINNITSTQTTLEQYERTDINFDVITVADNPSFPFDESMPENLNTGSGISVDMVFSNGLTTLTQPAFPDMEYSRNGDQLLPSGQFRWTVRMSFAQTGTWTSEVVALDAGGQNSFTGPAFTVAASETNDGFIRASAADNRYFEYESGRPFVPVGHGTSASDPSSTDQEIAAWADNNVNFGRFWLSSASPLSDPWSSWATHHTMESNGYMPPPLLTSSQKYGNGQFSYRIAAPAIDNVNTPAIFRGFWEQPVAVIPSSTYRIIARVKTVDVTGGGGLVLKTGTWLGTDVINQGVGTVITPYASGDNQWFYLIGEINTHSTQNALDYIYLVLENSTGEAYLDQMTIQRLHPDGSLDQNILPKWNANSHMYLDPIKPKEADYMIEAANNNGIHYKIVIHEKGDYIKNNLDIAGFPSTTHGAFEQPPHTPLSRLYQYYWRNLIARWGYATSVHSWELVNEGAPGSYLNLTNDLHSYFAQNSPYPRMTSTSFWSEWVPEFWQEANSEYGDVHAYVMTTGYLNSAVIDGITYTRQELQRDAAAMLYAYSVNIGNDPERTKPIVIGETDLDQEDNQEPDPLLADDTDGIWLHNFTWAHINHGGVSALIWDPIYIRSNNLYPRYRKFMEFMEDIPLNNGRYEPVDATATDPWLRVWGQVDNAGIAAHFWVQNRQHTWHRVAVEEIAPTPISGTITVNGLAEGQAELEWWYPWGEDTGPVQTQTISIPESGVIEINIEGLTRDLAFKVRVLDPVLPGLPSGDWAQHQQNAARTGRTEVSVAPPYRIRWVWAGPNNIYRNAQSHPGQPGWTDDLTSRPGYNFPLPDQMNFTIAGGVQPVIFGFRLYFGTMDGDAYALDMRDGTTFWESSIPGGTITSAGVFENNAVFVGVRGTVFAFDTLTGDQRWSYNTRGAITSPPTIHGNSVIVANNKGRVTRLDAQGQVIWERVLPAPVVGGLAAAGNRVYVPAEDMVVYSLNLATGETVASQAVTGQSFRMTYLVVHNGRVYVTTVQIPMVGSEYVMEGVMASSNTIEEENDNIRLWLQGSGSWADRSPDWQHFFVLDAETLEDQFLVASGPVDGCGYPAPMPVVDANGNVIKWWKTRFPTVTTSGNVFGTNYSIDLSAVDQSNGNRQVIGNGLSNFQFLETDNLYGLSIGGNYLWMRQNFRGTAIVNLSNTANSYRLVQVTTRVNDGGDFSSADIYYRESNQWNGYLSQPYLVSQPRTHSRVAPAIAGKYVFISEEFGIVAIETIE